MEIIEKLNDLFLQKAYAASLGDSLNDAVSGLSGDSIKDENDLINQIVKIAVPLGIACAVLLLVYGGYMLMSSQGNPDKLQEARGVITNAIIGLLVVLLSVSILLLISNSLGLEIYS